MVIFFFVLLLISYFELSTETKELIITLSESVKNKAELHVKNVEHSKNDYHERSKQVPKDWHSGDYDAK